MEHKFIKTIERDFAKLEEKIAELKERVLNDFTYAFEWDYVGELYRKQKQRNLYKQFFAELNYDDGNVLEWLTIQISSIKEELLRGRYLGSSTNIMSNLGHTYTKEVKAEMLPILEWYLEELSKTK